MNLKRLSQVGLTLVLLSSVFAENVTVNINKFNAGELSPLMNARADVSKYRSGARTLENMLVRTQGPIMRRPGTKYIAAVKDANDPTRIFPFEYSTEDAYIVEGGDDYFRFFRDGAPIGAPYEIVSPYDSNDIFDVQFVQDAQVMRMVHPVYPPHKLTRTGHAAWTMTEITFKGGPFLDENETKTSTIEPSATSGTITLTAIDDIFDADHVGALWQISEIVDGETIEGRFHTNGDSDSTSISVFKDQTYTVTTGGDWFGTLHIQRSYDSGSTWNTVKPFASRGNFNVVWDGFEENEDADYRIAMRDQVTTSHQRRHGEGECDYTLATDVFTRHGWVEITVVGSATSATAVVDPNATLASTDATFKWSEGAWSTFRGFPRTVEHHELRCVYAGSTSFPQTVWASVVASKDTDYDDFSVSAEPTDADAWTYVLPGMNPVQWMRSQELLMIGTTSAIGILGQPDVAITAITSPTYRTQAKNGSDYIQAVTAVDAVLFVERGGQKVREAQYTFSSNRYVAPDMTILAEHITGTGITQIAFQNRPDPILWCVRDDGQLLSFTYQRRNGVLAWSRNDTGITDSFESVAVIPGATTEDELWVVAGRTVDSSSVRYVEQMQPYDWGTDQNDVWFVDAGSTDGNDLSYLEGETVTVFADARPIGTFVVSSGSISASGYSNYVIGLPFTSVYESMPIITTINNKTTAGRNARIRSLRVDVHETLGFHVGSTAENVSDIQFSTDAFATTIDVYTGFKPSYNYMPFMHGWAIEQIVYMEESDPIPLTIRGIQMKMEIVK